MAPEEPRRDLPSPRPVDTQVDLGRWTFGIREGWRPKGGKLPEIRSPSSGGLIQISIAEVKPYASPEALSLTAKTTLESAGMVNPTVGGVMTLPSGEQLVGGQGPAPGGLDMTVLVVGKETSMLVMTYLHDGQIAQEQADAEATMASARLGPEPPKREGFIGRLLGR